MVDRFANGDPANDGAIDPLDPQAFHGGDLQGVIDHLDHIQALGADTVWLSPVFRMRTTPFFGHGAFHGYWVEDFGAIEPRFGDTSTLARLSDELHRRDMKLLLDVVWNHVAPDGELTRAQPGWFHPSLPVELWEDPVQVVEREVHGLPDLAQEKDEVARHLRDVSVSWIRDVRPDGFRVDAVRHMPVSFLGWMAEELRAVAGEEFSLLGEVFDGDPAKVAAATAGGGFDAVFDFPLHFAMVDVFCGGKPPGALGAVLSQDDAYPAGTDLVTFLDNHDRPRILGACGGDVAKVHAALDFQLATRGTPSLTWGIEAGQAGVEEPHNRGDMRFGPTDTSRHIRALADRREAHVALREGETRHVSLDDSLYVFARVHPAETLWVAVNTGDTSRDVSGHAAPPHGVAVFPGPPPDAPATVTVRLRGHAPLGPGDELRLVGGGPALGQWDPARGIRLPAKVELPREVYAMKLVIRRADGSVEWEPVGNRYWLPEGGRTTLEWGEG